MGKMSGNSSTFIRGSPFVQIFQTYEVLEPFYTEFEKNYDPLPILDYMASLSYAIPLGIVTVYLLLCYLGTNYMKDKKPLNLSNQLAAWNLFLALFSIYGTIRVVPHFLYKLSNMTFEESVCDSAHTYFGAGAAGLAVQFFILSKIPELLDTAFIVLRKKPLIFLHWYHHVSVLLFCWISYVTESGAGIYFVAMNYTVHALMYSYYFLNAVKLLPKWFPSWIITTFQIVQMIIGTGIVIATFYYYKYGGQKYPPGECHNDLSNIVVGVLIYSSYLYLFMEYAVKRFIFTKKGPRKTGKKDGIDEIVDVNIKNRKMK